jgi:copper(I)-binding protein
MTSLHAPTRIRRARTAGVAVAVGLLALGAVACGDDSTSDSAATAAPTVADTAAPETAAPAGEVVITGQWARTSPADSANGAAYLTITSPVDDKLTSAVVDASVAEMSQIHETVMSGAVGSDTTMAGGMGSDTTMSGTGEMSMRPVEFIELKAGTPMEMKPGGYHIMMMGLVNPLKLGDTITVTLTLENAGEITVDVPVLDEAP